MSSYIVLPLARQITQDGAFLRALAITDTENRETKIEEYSYQDVDQVLEGMGIDRNDCYVLATVTLSPSEFKERVKRGF